MLNNIYRLGFQVKDILMRSDQGTLSPLTIPNNQVVVHMRHEVKRISDLIKKCERAEDWMSEFTCKIGENISHDGLGLGLIQDSQI